MLVVLRNLFQRCARTFVPRQFTVAATLAKGDGGAQGFGKRREEGRERRVVIFDDSERSIQGKSTWEVVRGWLVFKLLSYDILVDNSLKLYHVSKRVLGLWMSERLLRITLLGQFAGGLDERDCKTTVLRLAEQNVSSLWFFSIERDVGEVSNPHSREELNKQEEMFDGVNKSYIRSIEMSATYNCDRPLKFAAVKMTAIVNPTLLSKLNRMLVASAEVFLSLSTPVECITDRYILPDSLHQAFPTLQLGEQSSGRNTTIVEWNTHFSLADGLQQLELFGDKFSDMELEQFGRFSQRLELIGIAARNNDVCVMVDAEQRHFQRAIEHLTLHQLARQYYNSGSSKPLIYNTLQTYLTDSYDTLLTYEAIAKHYGIKFGIKVVRGCYMEYEKRQAQILGQKSPVYANKSLTDMSYHHCMEHLMTQVCNQNACIMVASHNRQTMQRAMELMKENDIPVGDERVVFGQLLGMGDNLLFPVANAGYNTVKVVTYGSLDDIVPFLARRGNENRVMMKNAQKEHKIYSQELQRRLLRQKD